jgi:hypothetical protein
MFKNLKQGVVTKRSFSAKILEQNYKFQNKGFNSNFITMNINPFEGFKTKNNFCSNKKVLSSSIPRFLLLGGTEFSKLRPPQQDQSASVYLTAPPNDHVEDKDIAKYLGVNAFYKSLYSYYSLKFEKKDSDIELRDYVERTKLEFYSKTPYGTISEVNLHPQLVEHFVPELDFAVLFLDKRGLPDIIQRIAEFVLFLKTPGGFWNISCTSTFYTLGSQKDILFGNLLKNLRIELNSRGETKQGENLKVAAPNIPLVQSIQNQSVFLKSKRKKRIKKNLPVTLQGNVGIFNISQPEAIENDDKDEID